MSKLDLICEEIEALEELAEQNARDLGQLMRVSSQTLTAVNDLRQKLGQALDELAEVPALRRQLVVLENRVRAAG